MRQFISETLPDKNGEIILSEKDYKYLKQVLRIKIGDIISVRLPNGELKKMKTTKINSKSKKLSLELNDDDFTDNDITRGVKASEINTILKTEFWLFQFIPKIQKFEQIVRQATECGVSVIVPVIGEFCEKGAISAMENPDKIERLNKIIREARQQSGSPVDTRLWFPVSLGEACKLWKTKSLDENSVAFALSEHDESLHSMLSSIPKGEVNIAAIACGAEGGISKQEMELMERNGYFTPVHFESNILRCETAAIYGIAALQTALCK